MAQCRCYVGDLEVPMARCSHTGLLLVCLSQFLCVPSPGTRTAFMLSPSRWHKGEEKQLRSVVGSLSWIARQGRPDILYRVSKLQSGIKGATVSTLKEANKVLELELNGMDLKLRYKNGPFNFQELGVLTASDTSCWRTRQ